MGLQGEFLKCLIFEGPSGRLEGLEVRFKFDSNDRFMMLKKNKFWLKIK